MSIVQELLSKIQSSIDQTNLHDTRDTKGTVTQVKDGVALISGLNQVKFSEIISFESGLQGLVLDLDTDQVGALILGPVDQIKQGMIVKSTGQVFSIPVGEQYLGRVVNGLGTPIDGGEPITSKEIYPVERIAPGVITRKSVHQPLQTGIKAIDCMIPIGKGQRELIIGDRQTGKTTIAIDTILNQKKENVKCIYVAIGQKESKIRRIVEELKTKGAMDYTIIVNAPASSPAVMQYIAPYVGITLAEYFLYNGQDALIIYDDLTKHANAYREIALLLRRPPGREAYPGDVFYLHSKLLERSAKLNEEYGLGSCTALPIIETQANDISAYIPTNVISITDGQIFLETDLFNAGIRPAVNVGLSVSRVGGSAQTKLVKKVASKLKLELAYFRELQAFAQFASDLDDTTRKKIERGKALVELLKQPHGEPLEFYKQAVIMYGGINGYIDNLTTEQIKQVELRIIEKLDTSYSSLSELMNTKKELSSDIEDQIKILINEVITELI
ncbi:MAG TPA: F0F1 ATP synthase subunit alpha [Candidatus Absconditabacterales bacterium]|nr:F0F1 ATP synthase subunit alpha [Candidatus Absconditabacterales bacterium]